MIKHKWKKTGIWLSIIIRWNGEKPIVFFILGGNVIRSSEPTCRAKKECLLWNVNGALIQGFAANSFSPVHFLLFAFNIVSLVLDSPMFNWEMRERENYSRELEFPSPPPPFFLFVGFAWLKRNVLHCVCKYGWMDSGRYCRYTVCSTTSNIHSPSQSILAWHDSHFGENVHFIH